MINKSRIALITGVNGQDGSYLARFLLTKGYEAWGTSRDADGSSLNNLKILGIKNQIKMISMTPEDFRSVLATVDTCNPEKAQMILGWKAAVGIQKVIHNLINEIHD